MTVFERLVEDLKKVDYFKDYKYRKRDSTFIYKFDGGFKDVGLEHCIKFGDLRVQPTIGFHYDIVVKWFEKYSTLSLRDQRDNPLYFIAPYRLGFKGNDTSLGHGFEMRSDGSDYEAVAPLLIHAVTECARYVDNKFKTLEDYYNFEIAPYLTGEKDTPMNGAYWFFEGLTVCRIVAPENYERLKEIFMKRAHWMMNEWKYAPERNMQPYYNRLDEILSDMESRFPVRDN